MQKIAAHPILNKDNDFRLFLECDNLQSEMKTKEQKSSFMSKFGDLSMGFSKTTEVDEWFENKRVYVDNLENQLKNAAKSVDAVIKHREALADSAAEFGDSVLSLATTEINKASENHLQQFGQVQKQLKLVHEKQAAEDILYLANTLDEYIRIAGSIKTAMGTRHKAYQTWQVAEQTLIKNRIALEKAKLSAKTKADKVAQIESDILESESRVVASKKEFEDISKLLKEELDMFEREKVEDFQRSMQSFLEGTLRNQQKIVTLWDTYLKETESLPETEA